MRLVLGEDQIVGEWVARRIPQMCGQVWTGPFVAVGVKDGDELVAGCIWHNWIPGYGSIEVSFAAETPRWATRSIVRALLWGPFVGWKCQRINAFTTDDNTRARRLLARLGFREEGLMRRGFGRRDAVIFGLLVEDWFDGPYGPERA